MRIPAGNAVAKLKSKLRANRLVTVCEEASCPNIHECFGKGTATFMILGEVCTRRCSFCDVAHGRPKPPDAEEPRHLAETIRDMGLRYVVITSVDRDDLRDGGASHFAECIREVRKENPNLKIEILTPDFRGKGRMERALEAARRRAAGCVQPQSGNRARAVSERASGRRLRLVAGSFAKIQGTASGRADQIGHHARTRRNAGTGSRRIERFARSRGRYGNDRPVSAADRAPSSGAALLDTGRIQRIGRLRPSTRLQHVASGPLVRSSYHADQMAHEAGFVDVA